MDKKFSEILSIYNEKHNYFGADYQSGDNYGICFIFPYLIWYYFGKYYNQRAIGKKKVYD